MSYFKIIQGGMGVGVSNWILARAVSQTGQLGVVSGTALDIVLARRLQLGDPEGHIRRAMAAFPIPEISRRVLDTYFIEGGKRGDQTFRSVPIASHEYNPTLAELTILGNFVEVFLAKEGHSGAVGINFLEKIQIPTLPSLFGAILAGVDYILMGAGIPRSIPRILDRLVAGEPVELKLNVVDAQPTDDFSCRFNPRTLFPNDFPALIRPKFLAIVSSATLALTLARKSDGKVDGFVIEGPSAGGHNAPPRGPMQLSARGEPIYSVRDVPDLEKIRDLKLPFWLAGSYAEPSRLAEALRSGAEGVQVGTAFAFCEESGIEPELKQRVIEQSQQGRIEVFTDPLASPTSFPFKVLKLDDSLSNPDVYSERQRVCDLGYLRHAYRKEEGSVGYRCPGEPVEDYVRKGGDSQETQGRKCVCNGLLANIGLGQVRSRGEEKMLVTAGDDAAHVARFLKPGQTSYTAEDVISYLLHEEVSQCQT
jgi:nitronate monooxygenase